MTKVLQGHKIEWRKWYSPFKNDDEQYDDHPQLQTFSYPKQVMDTVEREFNLWILHTNFYIDENVASAIELTKGIETFDIVSPYRARVGIGQLFDEIEVQVTVRRNIDKLIKNRDKLPKTSFAAAVNRLFSVGSTNDTKEE